MIDIRKSNADDYPDILALYPKVFPDEDLMPVVSDLLNGDAPILSLVASIDGRIVGHIIFTLCGVSKSTHKLGLLAPLGVVPDYQKQGIGSSLIDAGHELLVAAGVDHVFVLGDPNYYGRFGYRAGDMISPPYPIPEAWSEAWQSKKLIETSTNLEAGTLVVPAAWMKPALWA